MSFDKVAFGHQTAALKRCSDWDMAQQALADALGLSIVLGYQEFAPAVLARLKLWMPRKPMFACACQTSDDRPTRQSPEDNS